MAGVPQFHTKNYTYLGMHSRRWSVLRNADIWLQRHCQLFQAPLLSRHLMELYGDLGLARDQTQPSPPENLLWPPRRSHDSEADLGGTAVLPACMLGGSLHLWGCL